MIQNKSPQQHELMEEILSLTMLLKSQYPSLYAHLSETPVFDESAKGNEVKALQDYRDTLVSQLEEADADMADQHKENPVVPTPVHPS